MSDTTTEPATVHILTIDHRHGRNTTAYSTPEKAYAALVDWCREWWTETGISADEMPTDENELITSYFEEVESEYYELEACKIQ